MKKYRKKTLIEKEGGSIEEFEALDAVQKKLFLESIENPDFQDALSKNPRDSIHLDLVIGDYRKEDIVSILKMIIARLPSTQNDHEEKHSDTKSVADARLEQAISALFNISNRTGPKGRDIESTMIKATKIYVELLDSDNLQEDDPNTISKILVDLPELPVYYETIKRNNILKPYTKYWSEHKDRLIAKVRSEDFKEVKDRQRQLEELADTFSRPFKKDSKK